MADEDRNRKNSIHSARKLKRETKRGGFFSQIVFSPKFVKNSVLPSIESNTNISTLPFEEEATLNSNTPKRKIFGFKYTLDSGVSKIMSLTPIDCY